MASVDDFAPAGHFLEFVKDEQNPRPRGSGLGAGQATALNNRQAIGKNGYLVRPMQGSQHRRGILHQFRAIGQELQVAGAESGRRMRDLKGLQQQLEPPHLHQAGRELSFLHPLPEGLVDPPVGRQVIGAKGNADLPQRSFEGRALGPVVVEERPVGVKQQPPVPRPADVHCLLHSNCGPSLVPALHAVKPELPLPSAAGRARKTTGS